MGMKHEGLEIKSFLILFSAVFHNIFLQDKIKTKDQWMNSE